MPTRTAASRTCLFAVLLALFGCAADQPSKPMAPTPKPAPSSSASTSMQKATTVPAKANTIATTPAARRTSSVATSTPTPQDKSAASPEARRAPQSAASPAPVPTITTATPATPPAAKPVVAIAPQAAPTTADFSTALLFPDPDPSTASERQIALCEFISGRWTPIMSAPVQTYSGGTRGVTFRAVPVRRMVLPMYLVGDEPTPAANPWLIESTGKVRELQGPCAICPSNEPPILTLELRPAAPGTQSAAMVNEPADYGVIAVRAEQGRRFTLSYWDNAWKPIGEATLADQPVRIEGVPSKRVLWLKSEEENLTLPVVP